MNDATLTVNYSTISNNTVVFGASGSGVAGVGGGGIYNRGTLIVNSSTINDNSAGITDYSDGGGVLSWGPATIINSTIYHNTASEAGGGITDAGNTLMTITNSTICNNAALSSGTYQTLGGGIYAYYSGNGEIILNNSIVAGNSQYNAVGYNDNGYEDFCGQPQAASSNNIIGVWPNANAVPSGLAFNATNQVGTTVDPMNPMLGPLANNGGSTQTMALLPGSPAIDAGITLWRSMPTTIH